MAKTQKGKKIVPVKSYKRVKPGGVKKLRALGNFAGLPLNKISGG